MTRVPRAELLTFASSVPRGRARPAAPTLSLGLLALATLAPTVAHAQLDNAYAQAARETSASDDASDGGLAHGVVGAGATMLVDDQRVVAGPELRAGVLLTMDDFELGIVGSFGLLVDELASIGTELQPNLGTCLELGGATERDADVRAHFGAHLCGGYVELRTIGRSSGSTFPIDASSAWAGGGLQAALTFAMTRTWRVGARLDADARVLFLGDHVGVFFAPTLWLVFLAE